MTRRRGARAAAAELRELVVSTLQDVRRLAVELRPSALDDFGLVAGARAARRDRSPSRPGSRSTSRRRSADERLPAEVETALYRIVQESLTNVVKHARARRVSILLARKNGAVKAVVEDDGRGSTRPSSPTDGFGLVGMRERLALLGGRLEVESRRDARHDDRRGGAGRVSVRVLIVDDHAVVRAGLATARQRRGRPRGGRRGRQRPRGDLRGAHARSPTSS